MTRSRTTGGPRSRASRSQGSRGLRLPLVALGGVLVLFAVVAVVWATGSGRGTPSGSDAAGTGGRTAASATPNPFSSLARRIPGDPLAMGDVHAPVVMVMWSDFQCPFCGQFARDTEPQLVDRYVKKGTLRLEWRDFPYIGAQSAPAASAARAAGQQGAFWAFHDALYALKLPPNSGQLTDERLTAIAASLHLDIPRFTAAMKSPQVSDAVSADFAQGQSLGIDGTPAFVVNGRPVVGAQPVQVFEQIIDEAAAQARRSGPAG